MSRHILLLAEGLQLDKFIIAPAQRKELVVSARLTDRTLLDEVSAGTRQQQSTPSTGKHSHAVCVLDRRQAMRDSDGRSSLRGLIERSLDNLFRVRVQR